MNDPELDRRQFLAATGVAASVVLVANPGDAGAPEPGGVPTVGVTISTTIPEEVAKLTVKDVNEIRLLQLTDIHFFCKAMLPRCDEQTLEDLPKLVELTKPDLLLVTGDLWHENPEGRGEEYMRYGVEQITKLGVPWLFLWGNHDAVNDFNAAHDYIAKAENSLYRGGINGGHYIVELVDEAGKCVWELICLNSNERGHMGLAQDWLKTLVGKRGKLGVRPPALCLVHIPLKQYDTLWNEEKAFGVKLEGVAYWEEDSQTLPALKAASNVRAVFCGHDHINDYAGTVDNVELVYGHATGTGGYGDNMLPKGAKLITLNAGDGTYSWETVLPNGERWKTAEGMRIDDVDEVPWDVPSKARRNP